MALGRQAGRRQGELWLAADQIARGAGHAFYDRLDQLLRRCLQSTSCLASRRDMRLIMAM